MRAALEPLVVEKLKLAYHRRGRNYELTLSHYWRTNTLF